MEDMAIKVFMTIISIIVVIAMFIISILIYFLPSTLAYRKQHSNKTAILILNLFLGWTLIGWVGALVWAVSTNEETKNSNNSKYEDLERLQKLKDNGTISEEEFKTEKEKIMKQ